MTPQPGVHVAEWVKRIDQSNNLFRIIIINSHQTNSKLIEAFKKWNDESQDDPDGFDDLKKGDEITLADTLIKYLNK